MGTRRTTESRSSMTLFRQPQLSVSDSNAICDLPAAEFQEYRSTIGRVVVEAGDGRSARCGRVAAAGSARRPTPTRPWAFWSARASDRGKCQRSAEEASTAIPSPLCSKNTRGIGPQVVDVDLTMPGKIPIVSICMQIAPRTFVSRIVRKSAQNPKEIAYDKP